MSLLAMLRVAAVSLLLAFCLTSNTMAAKKHTLLVVFTHGDDVASIAPLLGKSSAEGHTVYYAIFPWLQPPTRWGKH